MISNGVSHITCSHGNGIQSRTLVPPLTREAAARRRLGLLCQHDEGLIWMDLYSDPSTVVSPDSFQAHPNKAESRSLVNGLNFIQLLFELLFHIEFYSRSLVIEFLNGNLIHKII